MLGVFIFQAYYLIELLIVWFIFYSWLALGIYTLIKILSGWFSLHFMMYKRKTVGAFRYASLKKNRAGELNDLICLRNRIYVLLSEMK